MIQIDKMISSEDDRLKMVKERDNMLTFINIFSCCASTYFCVAS